MDLWSPVPRRWPSPPPARSRACALATLWFAVVANLAAAPASSVRAEDAGAAAAAPALPTVELPPVDVHRRAAERTQDPTAAVTVVHAERFAGETKQVAELVSTSPGVAVSSYGGLGQLSTVSIRGSTGDGVLVLLDGIPLNSAFGGGVDLSTIPRHWIDRLEVIRGAEGAHYGAGSMGGVVNVITRAGQPGRWSAEAGGGSFGTATVSAEGAAGGRTSGGAWTLFSAAGGERTDGRFPYRWNLTPSAPSGDWRDLVRRNDGSRRGAVISKLTADVGALRIDALAQLSGGRRELAGWPAYETPHDWQEDARALIAVRVRGPGPGEALSWSARASLRADWLTLRMGDAPTHQRGTEASLQGGGEYAHPRGKLTLTGEASDDAIRAPGLSPRSRAQLATTLAEDLSLGRLRLTPAVRAERVGGFEGLSAKLGAVLRLAGPLSLRASAGRTFRAPSFAELYLEQGLLQPNPTLRPETAIAADGGVVLDGKLGFGALGGYATRYRDLIYYQTTGFGRAKPFNAGKALVYGLEVEGASAPAPRLLGLSLSLAYTWLASENLRGAGEELGKDVPRRPRHRLFARAAIAPGPFEAHLEVHRVGRQFADARNTEVIPAALVWNTGAAVRLLRNPDLRLGVEVRNLADDRTLQDPLRNPLPGRTVLVTLRGGSPTKGTP